MVELTAGDERYREDRGTADPAVADALAAYAAGAAGEHPALTALAAARLLVPVVAVPGGAGPLAGEKTSEMALPALVGKDGRRALPAFTCLDAVRRWKASARPVPVQAEAVWQSAVAEASAVVIDIAGPVPLLVEGARLAALATGTVLGMHEDPDVWQQVAAAAAEVAPGVRIKLSPPNGDIDFTLELAPPEGVAGPVPSDVADRIGDAVLAALRDRVRAGIAVLVRPGSPA
jgi:SseB protein N-terminal domain